jgi:hypothetical protein
MVHSLALPLLIAAARTKHAKPADDAGMLELSLACDSPTKRPGEAFPFTLTVVNRTKRLVTIDNGSLTAFATFVADTGDPIPPVALR